MGKVSISGESYSDRPGTVWAGADVAPAMPLERMATQDPTDMCRFLTRTPSFTVVLPEAETITDIDLLFDDLPPTATWRVRVAEDAAQLALSAADIETLGLGPVRDVLDPAIALTRATAGTRFDGDGVLRAAAAGVPRFDFAPHALAPRGLLIEPQRDKLALHSNALDDAAWVAPGGLAVTPGEATGPDGLASLAELAAAEASDGGLLQQEVAVPGGTVVTASLVAAAGTVDRAALGIGTAIAAFDLGDGAVIAVTDPDLVARATRLRDGCWALSVTAPVSAVGEFFLADENGNPIVLSEGQEIALGAALAMTVAIPDAAGDVDWSPAGTETIYAGFAGLEPGGYPTSYVAVAGDPVTRAADVAVLALPAGAWRIVTTSESGETTHLVTTGGGWPIVLPGEDVHLARIVAEPTGVLADTGIGYVWPETQPFGQDPWGAFAWDGRVARPEGRRAHVALAAAVYGKAIGIEVWAEDRPDPWCDFRRLFVHTPFRPEDNIDRDWTVEVVDDSRVTRTRGGGVAIDPTLTYRRITFNLSWLYGAEAFGPVFSQEYEGGVGRFWLVIIDPDDARHGHVNWVYGPVERLAAVQRVPAGDRYRKSHAFVEVR